MKLKKQKNGQSIIEVLIGAGIVLGGAAVVGTLVSNYQKINKKAEVKAASLSVAGDLASLGRKVFLMNQDSLGKNTEGICRYLSTDATSGGVANIYFTLPKKTGALQPAWAKVISSSGSSNWEIADEKLKLCGDTKNTDFFKCLIHKKFKGDFVEKIRDLKTGIITEKFNPVQKVVGSIEIIPQYLDYKKNSDKDKPKKFIFEKIPTDKLDKPLDAKEVSFKIVSKVTTFPPGQSRPDTSSGVPSTEEAESIFWSGDASACDKSINGKWYRLAASGSGRGDPTGRTIFNDSSFDTKNEPVLDGAWEKRQVQAGVFESGLVKTNPEQNIELSCNETRFTCSNEDNSQRVFEENVQGVFSLTYNDKTNSLTKTSNIRFVPSLAFSSPEKGSFKAEKDNLDLVLDDVFFAYSQQDGEYKSDFKDEKNQALKPQSLRARGGNHNLEFSIKEKNIGLCSKVCAAGNDSYYPTIEYTLPDFKDPRNDKNVFSGTIPSTSPVGCTVCYMKGCKRFGLKTFGPHKGARGVIAQPDEPLDGTIPECAVKSNADVHALTVKLDNYKASEGTGSCIKAKVDSQESGVFSFRRASCSESLPVMCFAYGKFTLAKKVSSTGSSYENLSQSAASNRCYQMGSETLDKAKLVALIGQSYEDKETAKKVTAVVNSISGSNTTTIINNANQGIFLAPQSSRQLKFAAEWLGDRHSTKLKDYFWVGLRVDSMGNPFADFPWMQSISHTDNSSNKQYSVFFNTESQLAVVRHDKNLSNIFSSERNRDLGLAKPTGADAGALLGHHVRYKGLIPVRSEQSVEFSFLCRGKSNPHEFFVTKDKSKQQSDGPSLCAKNSGWFLPPVTPLQWAKAFHLVQANHYNYSFPDPEGLASFAWVALSGDGSLNSEKWGVYGKGEMAEFIKAVESGTKKIFRNGEAVTESSDSTSSSESADSAAESTPKSVDTAYACFQSDGKIFLDNSADCGRSGTRLNRENMKSYVVQALWLLDANDSKDKGIKLD